MRFVFCIICFLILTPFAQTQDAGKVWILGAIPSEASESFAAQLANKLGADKEIVVTCESKYSMGHQETLQELLKNALSENVKCLVCLDEVTAAEAAGNRIPVVVAGDFSKGALPSGLRIVALQQPINEYIKALKATGWTGGRLALVLDKESAAAQEHCTEVNKLYSESFPESEVVKIEIDSKTCAQLMDFVFAYNFLKGKDVQAVYLSGAGNVTRIIPFILNVAKKLKIPVVGGGEGAARTGSCLTLLPNQDKLVDIVAEEVRMALNGKKQQEILPFRDFFLYYSPEELQRCGLSIPENSDWKALRDK